MPHPGRVTVELLADREDLIGSVSELRWREWGHWPEPTDPAWWLATTASEAGRDKLPITWVASDSSAALGAVGLGEFDIQERRDRSPWILGMIVHPQHRGRGVGRHLLTQLEAWASGQGYERVWVATGGPAVGFYQRCGWQLHETVERITGPDVAVLVKHLPLPHHSPS
jgi:GNAT superfamily N-acetyltransferase